VTHLGRSDAIEDLKTEVIAVALEDLGGERLTGGDALADRCEGILGQRLFHCHISGSHREEQRRLLVSQRRRDDVWRRWACRHEHGGGAGAKREHQRVAESVGVKHRRDRVAAVGARDAQNLCGVGVIGETTIDLAVHHELRGTGGSSRAQPEAGLLTRPHARRDRLGAGEDRIEAVDLGTDCVRQVAVAGDDGARHIRRAVDQLRDRACLLTRHDSHPCPGLDRHGRQVASWEHWIDEHRHRTDAGCTQKEGRHLEAVEHRHQDPVAWAHVEADERSAHPRREIAQHLIGNRAAQVADSDPVPAALTHVPVDEPVRQVELRHQINSSRSTLRGTMRRSIMPRKRLRRPKLAMTYGGQVLPSDDEQPPWHVQSRSAETLRHTGSRRQSCAWVPSVPGARPQGPPRPHSPRGGHPPTSHSFGSM